MNVRSYTGANVDSDHYLVYSLLAIIFNAQKFRGVKTEKMECDQTLWTSMWGSLKNKANKKIKESTYLEGQDVNDCEKVVNRILSAMEEVLGFEVPPIMSL